MAIDLDGLQVVNGAYNYDNNGNKTGLAKGYSQEVADQIDELITLVHMDDEALFNLVNKYDVIITEGKLENKSKDVSHYGNTNFRKSIVTDTWANEAEMLMSINGQNYWNEERDKAYGENEKNGNTLAMEAYEKRAEAAYNSGPISKTYVKIEGIKITLDLNKIVQKYKEFAMDIEDRKSTTTPQRTLKHEFAHVFLIVKFFLQMTNNEFKTVSSTDERNAKKIGNTYDGNPDTQTPVDTYELEAGP